MSVEICGFALLEEMARIAESKTWTAYIESDRRSPAVVEAVFGEAPDATWKFYTLDEARTMTEEWHHESDASWFGVAPDDISVPASVLIGELGYDRPIALDHRAGVPVVRFMMADGRWVHVADSAAALLASLGIERP